MQGKIANLESVVSVHCITLLDHVIKMRASCFDTDFASQMKLTTLSLIHCFDIHYITFYYIIYNIICVTTTGFMLQGVLNPVYSCISTQSMLILA